jgi:hypothetical protein
MSKNKDKDKISPLFYFEKRVGGTVIPYKPFGWRLDINGKMKFQSAVWDPRKESQLYYGLKTEPKKQIEDE